MSDAPPSGKEHYSQRARTVGASLGKVLQTLELTGRTVFPGRQNVIPMTDIPLCHHRSNVTYVLQMFQLATGTRLLPRQHTVRTHPCVLC